MMNMTVARIKYCLVFLVFFFCLTGCATSADQMNALDMSMMHYEQALRWQDYDAVVSFHKNEYKTLTEQKRQRLRMFRVTGYNVISMKVAPDFKNATQIVEIKYYNTDYQIVRDMTLTNQWEYDSATKRWYLTNPLPDFK